MAKKVHQKLKRFRSQFQNQPKPENIEHYPNNANTIKLLPPTVGPMLGEATHDHLRIMIRGANDNYKHLFNESDYFETGICQLSFNQEFTQGVQTRIFKLNKDFDLTGVAVYSQLIADKKYFYRIAYGNGHMDEFKTKQLDWSDIPVDHVHIHPDTKSNQPISFLLGSSRYVMRTGPVWSFDQKSDTIFRTALEKLTHDNKQVEFSIFCGDQIYADEPNIKTDDDLTSDFQFKYRHVFSTPYFNQLTRRIPSYMILDDHEIWNNYPDVNTVKSSDISDDQLKTIRIDGHRYFQAYQLSHSPSYEVKLLESPPQSSYNPKLGRLAVEKLVTAPRDYWYDFTCGCMDIFVMDCRTERIIATNRRNGIMYERQIQAFKQWLERDKDTRVKAVVVSVPLCPDYQDGTDQWGDERWRWQRDQLLDIIKETKAKRLMFLSGDIHSSMVCKVTHTDQDVNFYQVISSPLFWPTSLLGQGDVEDFNLEGSLSGNDNWQITTRPKQKAGCGQSNYFIKDDNICKIDVDLEGFNVIAFSRKGEILSNRYFKF